MREAVRAFKPGSASLVDDLVQETLGRIFLNLSVGKFRGESSLGTYAQRVARNVCLEHIRRRRFDSQVDPDGLKAPDSDGQPEATLMRAEDHRRNLAVLASLSPEARELFKLIFIEGLTYAEVGARLGISVAAVKLRVHRCRLTMRSVASEEPAGPLDPVRGLPRFERVDK